MLSELELEPPQHQSRSAVGIDLGVRVFAALSNGEKVQGPNALAKLKPWLAREQRNLARKVLFSRNWFKTKSKITKLNARAASLRADALNKASTAICKSHAIVVVEDLEIANMTASARGTMLVPGKNVAAKSSMNRRILDQGWGGFLRRLEYKTSWNGGLFVRVDPRNTSRTCASCGHVSAANRRNQRTFVCVRCNHAANADINAAINILERGLKLLQGRDAPGLPGEGSQHPSSQEARSGHSTA